MSTAPSPATTTEALGMLRAAMGYLNAADATAMAATAPQPGPGNPPGPAGPGQLLSTPPESTDSRGSG